MPRNTCTLITVFHSVESHPWMSPEMIAAMREINKLKFCDACGTQPLTKCDIFNFVTPRRAKCQHMVCAGCAKDPASMRMGRNNQRCKGTCADGTACTLLLENGTKSERNFCAEMMMAEKAEAARLHVHSLQMEHEKAGALTGAPPVQAAPGRKRKADYTEEEWVDMKETKRANKQAREERNARFNYMEKMFGPLKKHFIETVGHAGFVNLELNTNGGDDDVCADCVFD